MRYDPEPMRPTRRWIAVMCSLMAGGLVAHAARTPPVGAQAAVPLDKLKLPPGFKISIFAEGVADARGMALGAKGTVFVGSMSARNVYALVDKNGDGVADEMKIIATNVPNPAGVAFRNGSL